MVGIVRIAYAAFALALGIAAGALLGKTLLAILVTIVGYFPLRTAVARGLRPYHFVAPIDVRGESIRPQAQPIGPLAVALWIAPDTQLTR